jgi:hypothetical protein
MALAEINSCSSVAQTAMDALLRRAAGNSGSLERTAALEAFLDAVTSQNGHKYMLDKQLWVLNHF